MNLFPNAEAISKIKEPLHWTEEKCRIMTKACREMALFHKNHCPELAHLYQRRGFDPESIRSEKDLEKIPAIGVTAMKHYLLTSLPHEKAALKLTSSGTRGQKTQIWFDQESLDRVQAMLAVLWQQEGLVSKKPTNYLMVMYDPKDAKDLGIAFSDKNQQRFAPVAESFYAIKKNTQGEWEFQKELCISKLKEYAKEGNPVRIFGMPSFIYEILQALDLKNPITLPTHSYMMTGGGWKAAENKTVTREIFRELAAGLLGIPPENIRDGYGMAEHSAPYIECQAHRFHIPVYNRILVRDPISMEILPNGEMGLMELITPYNAMMPNLAILSTDLGYIDRDPCLCGWQSPTFTLVGRGGLTKHKGCAIHAGDIVKRG